MNVYRIGNCRYCNDISGKGAALYGGRWNSKDVYMLYTAGSRALAMLEAIAHLTTVTGGIDLCQCTLQIPETSIFELQADALPNGWNQYPAPDQLKNIGDQFIKAGKYMGMRVPSAIINEEYNYLLNPAHPEFRQANVIAIKPISVDNRVIYKGQQKSSY